MSDLQTKTYAPEFLQRLIADHEAEQAGATPEDSSAVQAKGDTMSDDLVTLAPQKRRSKLTHWPGCETVHLECLLVKVSDKARALQDEVKRLKAELAEAHERCRALELSVEQADELKAHAEASAAAEEAETDRVTAERDAAQAEVERLRAKVHELDHKLETAQIKLMTGHEGTSLDPVAQLRADVVRLTTERDEARAEVERLVFALQMAESSDREGKLIDSIPANDPDWIFSNTEMMSGPEEAWREENHRLRHERDAAQAEVERLRASGQEMRDTSRPSDETIWWKAFNSFLRDHSLTIEEVADQAQAALTIYRARWPR